MLNSGIIKRKNSPRTYYNSRKRNNLLNHTTRRKIPASVCAAEFCDIMYVALKMVDTQCRVNYTANGYCVFFQKQNFVFSMLEQARLFTLSIVANKGKELPEEEKPAFRALWVKVRNYGRT